MGSPSLLEAKAAKAAMRALCRGDSAKLLGGLAENDGCLWCRPSAAVATARGNEAWLRVARNDVRYRFVIDMARGA